ncbi:VOC family protein [Streptomyces sp. NPDC087440]|uniref:VOC family protein n=1 Tax=Streptomyces sp. NPDC087440 TaxID=3365790 RepID=UPI00382CB689
MSFMTPGNVVWFEIGTAAPQQVQDFYGSVLGWTFAVDPDSSVDGRTYTRIMAPGAPWPMGAIQQGDTGGDAEGSEAQGGEAEGGEVINLSVLSADVFADVDRLAVLGAKVLVPATRVREVTVFARLADPQGNTFSLFSQGASADLADRREATEQHLEQASFTPGPGMMAGFEIATTDSGATRGFYEAAFGWRFVPHPAAPGAFLVFTPGAQWPAGTLREDAADFAIPAILSADVAATAEAALAYGGRVDQAPAAGADGTVRARLADPQGNRFTVHALPTYAA